MLYCDNVTCRYCYRETNTGPLICTEEDVSIIQAGDAMNGWMLKCNNYKYTLVPEGSKVPVLLPGYDENTGLWPGQKPNPK